MFKMGIKVSLVSCKNDMCNKYSYIKCNVSNMDGMDFPTPVSRIPKVEKQNDMAINVYDYIVSKKIEKVTVF